MLIATNESAARETRSNDSAPPADVKPKRPAISPQERAERAAIRAEKARIAAAKVDDFYSDEDAAKLAEFRRYWAEILPPGTERISVLAMIEGPLGDWHAIVDRVVLMHEGGIDRVARDVLALAERADLCGSGRVRRRSPGKTASSDRVPAKITRGKLPAEVVESIEAAKGSLLEHVLGNRTPVLITISVPDGDRELVDWVIMKTVAISSRPDALEAACKNAIDFARSLDPLAQLSTDLIR